MLFIDFEKAFGTLKTEAVLKFIENLDIELPYSELIGYIYTHIPIYRNARATETDHPTWTRN